MKATLRPSAVQALWGGSQSPACCNGNRVAAGKRHLLLRAMRALKGMGLIDKKGKTVGVSLLVRSVAAQATISARDGQAHTFPR